MDVQVTPGIQVIGTQFSFRRGESMGLGDGVARFTK